VGSSDRVAGVLPADVTSFVGREKVVAAVAARLREPGTRLLTLTGPGGIGKSRLALRIAQSARPDYPHGTWWVDLSAITIDDLDVAAGAVAAALGIPATSEYLLTALTDKLADQQVLVVLDNCEHVMTAVTSLVRSLLEAAPRLVILATSRSKLAVSAEHTVVVPPLEISGDDRLADSEAVRLLLDRAAEQGVPLSEDDLRDAPQLCRLLDGIPLAIEIAAGRLSELTLAEILEQLTDQPPTHDVRDRRFHLLVGGPAEPHRQHHEALHRTLEWSRVRLPETEQRLWARLAVFSGGFDLAAARAVAADIVPASGVLAALTHLVRHSIVIAEARDGRTRYQMLETVRQFGFQLHSSAEELDAAIAAHAHYFRDLMARAAADWVSPREIRWMQIVEAEMPNIRAAFAYYYSGAGDPLVGAWMAVEFSQLRHWAWTSMVTDMRQYLAEGVKAHPRAPSVLLVRLLANQAWTAVIQGNCELARSLLDDAWTTAEQVSAPDIEALLLYVEGTWTWLAEPDNHAPTRAIELLTRAYHASQHCTPSDRYAAFYFLTLTVVFFGDAEAARAVSLQAQQEAAALEASWSVAWTWWARGMAELVHGGAAAANQAVGLFRRGLTMQRMLRGASSELAGNAESTWVLWGLACALAHRGDLVPAARLLPGLRPWQRVQQQAQALLVDGLGQDTLTEEIGYGAGLAIEDAVELALKYAVDEPVQSATRDISTLSGREQEVVELVANGLTSKEIGARLLISSHTVDRHVARIITRLDLPNRIALASWWRAQQATAPGVAQPVDD
jgi:predicted ATPase/DNA-binding CsgD family transcriptional regulator